MIFDLANGLSEEVLEKIRRHASGTEGQKTRMIKCHYCAHKAVKVFEDSRGHIETKCKKCGEIAVYNVVLRRDGPIMYRRLIV